MFDRRARLESCDGRARRRNSPRHAAAADAAGARARVPPPRRGRLDARRHRRRAARREGGVGRGARAGGWPRRDDLRHALPPGPRRGCRRSPRADRRARSYRARSTTRSASSSGAIPPGRSGSSTGSSSTARRTTSPPSSSGRARSTGRSSATSATRSSSRRGSSVDGWELVAAPGHADGQLCLLRDGVLVAADHLLGRITPTVGLWPASRADPLGDYLSALDRTIELAPRIALPGHGDPIEDPAGRARELKEHHRVRLGEAAAALGAEPQTGLRALVRALRRRAAARRASLRHRRDALAPRAARPRGRSSRGTGPTGPLPILPPDHVGDEIPPSIGALRGP